MKISKQTFNEFLEKDVIHNDRIIKFCLKQNSLTDAIKIAVLSRDVYNKKHQHQYRIENFQLQMFLEKISSLEDKIQDINKFDELLNLIVKEKIIGIGPLALYDIALRIGYYIKIKPELIYLHAGAKTGANNFFGRKIKNNYLTKEEFVSKVDDFKNFSCEEIEAFLCIHCNKKNNNRRC